MNLVLQVPDEHGWYHILVDDRCVYVLPQKGCSYSYLRLAHKILTNLGICDKIVTNFLNVMVLEVTVPTSPSKTH